MAIQNLGILKAQCGFCGERVGDVGDDQAYEVSTTLPQTGGATVVDIAEALGFEADALARRSRDDFVSTQGERDGGNRDTE